MGREWKIGDWCEYLGKRYFVVDVGCTFSGVSSLFASGRSPHDCISPSCDHTELKHLPDCTGWDWEAPKPIEAPPGYRLLTEVEIESGTIQSTDLFYTCFNEWSETNSTGTAVSETGRTYARKIEPKPIEPPAGYRLMERKEIVKEGDVCLTSRMGGPRWECTGSGALGCTVAYRMENYGEPAYARKIEPVYRPFANAEEFKPHREKWLLDMDGDQLRVTEVRGSGISTRHGNVSFGDAFRRFKFEDGSPFGVPET